MFMVQGERLALMTTHEQCGLSISIRTLLAGTLALNNRHRSGKENLDVGPE